MSKEAGKLTHIQFTKTLKKYSEAEILNKLYKYCGYQERCRQEVNKKLTDWGVNESNRKEFISRLTQENFLNEERFAKAFVRGKFRFTKWGTQKIIAGLKQKGISEILISEALKEIPEQEYLELLTKLIRQKLKSLKETDPWKKKYKLANYAIGKGFSPDKVWEIINSETGSSD